MADTVLHNKAEITLDPGNFEANSRKVVAALQQIQAAARAVDGPLSRTGQNAASTANSMANAARAAQQQRAAMASLSAALNANAASTSSLRGRTNQLAVAIGANTNAVRRNSTALHANSGASRANTTALHGNNAAITSLQTHIAALNTSVQTLTTNLSRLNQGAGGVAQGMGMMGRILAGLSLGLLAREAVQLTDAYTSLQMRLKVSTQGLASSAGAMADVSRIAKTVRADLDAVGQLYSKVAFAGGRLGATQTQVARVTETVGKGLKVFGASAQETTSVIIQLGQALASGRLQGDEFRSMSENAPALMEILSQSMGKTRGELKKLGSEGKITSEVLIKAFGSNSEAVKKLDRDFAELPVTVSESFTLLRNSIEETLGTNDKMVAGTRTLADAIQFLANNMSTVIPVVGALSLALGVGFVTASIRASVAAGTLRASLLGAFGGGLGLLITGAVVGIGALATSTLDAHRKVKMLAEQTDGAADATQKTGLEALQAARGVSVFGGAAGTAAGKLWDMAAGARAAAVETAKLNILKAQADYDTARGQTSEGLRERAYRTVNDKPRTVGDALRRVGTHAQITFDWLMKPSDDVAKRAEANALRNLNRAMQAADDLSARPMESFIPEIDRPAGSDEKRKPKGSKSDPVGDFWKGMEQAKTLAALTGIELESMTKQFELQDAANRKLKPLEIERINRLLAQTRAAKLMSDILDKTGDMRRENNLAEQQIWDKANGATDDQLALEKALYEYRARALKEQINIENEAYRSREAEYRKELERANSIKAIGRGLEYARSQSPAMANEYRANEIAQRKSDLDAAYNAPNSTMTARDYKLGQRGIQNEERDLANQFYTSMGDKIVGVADLFASVFGDRVGKSVSRMGQLLDAVVKAARGDMSGFGAVGKVMSLFTTNQDGSSNALGNQISDAMQNSLDSIGRTLGIGARKTDAVANATADTADSAAEIVVTGRKLPGQLAGTIAAALQGAGIGGAVGGQLGSIGGALGGAALQQFAGKALGAFAGPLGGIIGGLAGSLIGGLFGKKASQSNATITMGANGLGFDGSVKNGGDKRAMTGAAGSVISGLYDIADRLGGKLTGNPNVSIGQYDNQWRVSTTGQTGELSYGKKNKSKASLVDFGDDQQGAIAFAIKTALERGVITGLSDLSQKALNKLGSEAAISLIESFNEYKDELAEALDPIGFGARKLSDEFASMRTRMMEVAASAADLATLEEAFAKKRSALLENALSPLSNLKKSLNGNEGGVTLRDQLTAAEGVFGAMRKDILAGKTVDQDKFADAAANLNSLASQLYGTAGDAYQTTKLDINTMTDMLSKLITDKVNGTTTDIDPIVAAATSTTDAIRATGSATVDAIERLIQVVQSQSGGSVIRRAVDGKVDLY